MKNLIPSRSDLFNKLLDELEEFDADEQADTGYAKFFDQITSRLSEDQLSTIERDHRHSSAARESGEKYYASHLTKCVEIMVQRAIADSKKFENFCIPQAVALALIRMDQAGLDDLVSPFSCRDCGVILEICLLRDDAVQFWRECPFCGATIDTIIDDLEDDKDHEPPPIVSSSPPLSEKADDVLCV